VFISYNIKAQVRTLFLEVYTGLHWGDQMEIDHLEDVGVDGIILKCTLKCGEGH
jgi:hypothetical protein